MKSKIAAIFSILGAVTDVGNALLNGGQPNWATDFAALSVAVAVLFHHSEAHS